MEKDKERLQVIENIRKAVENSTLYILPCVNPDGVDLVTGAFPPASAVFKDAKTMSDGTDFPKDWKAAFFCIGIKIRAALYTAS